MYLDLTDKHRDWVAAQMLEANKRLEAEGDPVRVVSYSLSPDEDDDREWWINVKLQVPDDYFPDLPTVRENLDVWPIEKTDRHQDLFDELLETDPWTWPTFFPILWHYTRSQLIEQGITPAQPYTSEPANA